jgi:hypothetical protein
VACRLDPMSLHSWVLDRGCSGIVVAHHGVV